ncbi:MAG TPA: RecQ family ATP-dependent DNA helicase [Saprospiraceae bacterium]|nr:RecQ family ATP-dependent DNA helicase [Saprospiraceae bacterium]
MNSIAFIDTEIDRKSKTILDIGSIKSDGSQFRKTSIFEFIHFIKGSQFICGHNIFNHDIKYIGNALQDAGINSLNIIDTLYFSPLLFPTKPYHALLKDDKLQSEDTNNPLNDSIKAKDLFNDEVTAFRQTDDVLKRIYYFLLYDKREFQSFFRYLGFTSAYTNPKELIRQKFENEICLNAHLSTIIEKHPVELAYCLALIHSFIHHNKLQSITPPWVLKSYPKVEKIFFLLRSKPCIVGCPYCNKALDIYKGLKRFFGFESFRIYEGEPLQEIAVKAAVDNKSILAIFPTGGGKSLTFQLPALMNAENSSGLTIVISPLQSLMKDQVDNLEKVGITEAVTINGLLDPIERAKSFERVENGSASILYISPESLRSRTIERLILGRKIARFVIDEAHCFSSWGQDFRVDYLYIGDFIKSIQIKKNLEDSIPVSCFTATAKLKVIEDIRQYFKEKLSIDLELFNSKASRSNLKYEVLPKENEEEKYQTARGLIEAKNCPVIIYVSRTYKAYKLAERLNQDGYNARPYHGKMDKHEKTENQEAFMNGEVSIMVATSAFGMGVDKKDVGMVIHYDISDSLENYIQEAGRAGRDENMKADCYVLFNEEDLGKHFILLNQTKLSIKEIQQVWKAIKEITRFRSTVSNSALEIAQKAGWDDNVLEIETRVTTAIAALEEAGYLKRGQNMPRIFANSILTRNAQEAIQKISASIKFDEKQKIKGVRIIKKLYSSKSRKHTDDEAAESRVDYLAQHLGIVKEEVINIVNLLREEKILADTKDLTAFIKKGDKKNRSLNILETYARIENFLLPLLEEKEKTFNLKELNENAENNGCEEVSIKKLKTLFNFWTIKNWIKQKTLDYSRNHVAVVGRHPTGLLKEKLQKRHELAKFIIELLYERSLQSEAQEDKEDVLIEFSVHELKEAYEKSPTLFKHTISIDDIEDTLFYLARIEAIKIEGGFLVVYNSLTIKRLQLDNKKQYTKDDYEKLNQYYENKVHQIHIVGEYARKMIKDYRDALQFVEDYFQLNYDSFLRKYFPGSKADQLKLKMTPEKFRKLFGGLSPTQLKIINDKESKYIVVAAGPGSGKTKVLVHKLASLLLMEDVKHEQLLMVTFSRAAATEFRNRLLALIGNAALFIDIKTFHSYCFDLLGRVGNLEKSGDIIKKAIERIKNMEVELNRITKTVLVIDEAQDMDEDEFTLITTLMEQNEFMRVIAVGDDDQNIFEFRGSSSKYLEHFIMAKKATKHEMVENYRSKANLVHFFNQFVKKIRHRLKDTPIIARQNDFGTIRIVRYHSAHLITPLVKDLASTDLTGTTCVLTRTNEEALQIAGTLIRNGVPAKLNQSNDGFSLYNLLEVRFFVNELGLGEDVFLISDIVWDSAKSELIGKFRKSARLEVCTHMIKDFEAIHPKRKYRSDLEVFIRESRLEDFYNESGETIFVSTIHKAKGREFENVFLMLENFKSLKDEDIRLLYVAMTRAKRNLSIHLNGSFLDNLSAENMNWIHDSKIYLPPQELAIHLTHNDVQMGYFKFVQHRISKLVSGDPLNIKEDGCANMKNEMVLKFSRRFIETIQKHESKGFMMKSANVNFLVYWWDEESEKEVKIILPEVFFVKYENEDSDE